MKIKKTIWSTNLFHVSIILNFHRLLLLGGLHLHCDHLVLILQLFISLKHDRSIRMKVPLWPVFWLDILTAINVAVLGVKSTSYCSYKMSTMYPAATATMRTDWRLPPCQQWWHLPPCCLPSWVLANAGAVWPGLGPMWAAGCKLLGTRAERCTGPGSAVIKQQRHNAESLLSLECSSPNLSSQ